jgi:hypothetical protein
MYLRLYTVDIIARWTGIDEREESFRREYKWYLNVQLSL